MSLAAGTGTGNGVARSPATDVITTDNHHDRREGKRNGTVIRYGGGVVPGTGTGNSTRRRQILTEEEYQSALDRIISRDYFPSVPSLRRDAAVLDARARGDVAGAVAVRRAARRLERHEEAAEAEAMERGGAGEGDDDGPQCVTITGAGMGLDEFHRLATSEDNAEFEEVQREEVRERREVFDRVFGVTADAGDRRLALTDGSSAGEELKGNGGVQLQLKGVSGDREGSSATPLASDEFELPQPRIEAAGAGERPRNSLFFTPQLPPKASAAAPPPASKASNSHSSSGTSNALTDGGRDDPRTTGGSSSREQRLASEAEDTRLLMPPPAPVTRQRQQPPRQSGPLTSPATKKREREEETTKAKFIQPSQTRFPYQNESRLPTNSSSSRGRDLRGGVGGPFPASSDTDTDLDAPTPLSLPPSARSSSGRGQRGSDDAFVAMTPLIVPGGGGSGGGAGDGGNDPNASPIVTWGNVAGTPLVLGGEAGSGAMAGGTDGVDDHGQQQPSFSLPAEDEREAAARVAEASIVGGASTSSGKSGRGRKDRERRRAPLFPSAAAAGGGVRGRGPSASVADRAASLTPAARSLLDRSAGRHGGGTSLLGSSSSSASGKGKGAKVVDARMGSALRSALRGSYAAATPRLGGAWGRSSSSYPSSAAARTPRSSTPLRRKRGDAGAAASSSSSSSSSKRSRTAGGSGRRRVDGAVVGHITDGLLRLDG